MSTKFAAVLAGLAGAAQAQLRLSLNFLVKYDVLVIIKKCFDLAMTT